MTEEDKFMQALKSRGATYFGRTEGTGTTTIQVEHMGQCVNYKFDKDGKFLGKEE